MSKKRIVVALGGNALGNTLSEQMEAVKETSKAIITLIKAGNEVIVVHGNGPQVGMITLAMEAAAKSEVKTPVMPMSVNVAMSQGYIGYDLANAFREALLDNGLNMPVAAVICQTIVDKNDPAFKDPTKPIGSFYTEEEAKKMIEIGYTMKEDSGRGWRRVVASPKPIDIVEKESVRVMVEAGQLVVAAGGGGIPVTKEAGNHLKGASAVVDKDFAAEVLAEELDADFLVILTAVEKVAVNFGKPNQENLDVLSISDANKYIAENQFAPGSMLPKVQAAMKFAESKPGRKSLITLLEKAQEGLDGKTGTTIVAD